MRITLAEKRKTVIVDETWRMHRHRTALRQKLNHAAIELADPQFAAARLIDGLKRSETLHELLEHETKQIDKILTTLKGELSTTAAHRNELNYKHLGISKRRQQLEDAMRLNLEAPRRSQVTISDEGQTDATSLTDRSTSPLDSGRSTWRLPRQNYREDT